MYAVILVILLTTKTMKEKQYIQVSKYKLYPKHLLLIYNKKVLKLICK